MIWSTISCAGVWSDALAAAAGAGIVDDDLGAVRGHQLGDLGADPAARSRANRDPSFEHAHCAVVLVLLPPQVVAGCMVFVNQTSRGCGIIVARDDDGAGGSDGKRNGIFCH